ncbi:hypothetical protein ACFRLW_44065 [Streptomyces sp. NPDC056728]
MTPRSRALEEGGYPRRDINRTPRDRVRAGISEKAFHAACGSGNLTEALARFRSCAMRVRRWPR